MAEVKLESRIPALAGAVKGRAKQRVHLVALTALAKAQELVPVDTGELRDSLYVAPTEDGEVIGAGAEHALFVELGTVHMAAQPYLTPAMQFAAEAFGTAFETFFEGSE